MKNVFWISVSLFIHLAFGSALWFANHEASHSLNEEVLDLTLATPISLENKSALTKPATPPKEAPRINESADNKTASENVPTATSNETTSATSSSSDGESAPVGWREVTRFPKVAKEVKASYPQEAKKAGIDGPVVLDVLVDRMGRVRDVIVISGPGYGLNESAIEALKQFEFQPAQKGSEPVAVKIRYTYRFKLGVN